MAKATFRVWRGDRSGGEFREYPTEVSEGQLRELGIRVVADAP